MRQLKLQISIFCSLAQVRPQRSDQGGTEYDVLHRMFEHMYVFLGDNIYPICMRARRPELPGRFCARFQRWLFSLLKVLDLRLCRLMTWHFAEAGISFLSSLCSNKNLTCHIASRRGQKVAFRHTLSLRKAMVSALTVSEVSSSEASRSHCHIFVELLS